MSMLCLEFALNRYLPFYILDMTLVLPEVHVLILLCLATLGFNNAIDI